MFTRQVYKSLHVDYKLLMLKKNLCEKGVLYKLIAMEKIIASC